MIIEVLSILGEAIILVDVLAVIIAYVLLIWRLVNLL